MARLPLVTLTFTLLLAPLTTAGADDFEEKLQDLRGTSFWKKLDAIAWMGRQQSAQSLAALREFCYRTKSHPHLEKVASEIADYKTDKVLAQVRALANRDGNGQVRYVMVWGLREAGDESAEAAKVYERSLRDSDERVRSQAARAIAEMKIASCKDALKKSLRDRDPLAGRDKLAAAAALELTDAVDDIVKMCRSGDPETRAAALEALAQLDVARFKEEAAKAVADRKGEVRMGVAYGCLHVKSDDGFDLAAKLIGDKDWRVRVCAIDPLVAWHEKRCVTAMVAQFAKEEARLRYDFNVALTHMLDKDLGYDGKPWQNWWNAAGADYEMPKKPKKARKGKLSTEAGGGDKGGSIATFFGLPILSDAVVFAIDFSGSMRNQLKPKAGPYKKKKVSKLEAALLELENAVNQFTKGQRFSGVNISTEAVKQNKRFLSKVLVRASRGNSFRLLQAFKAVDAAMLKAGSNVGRGDVWDALVDGIENIKGDPDTMILLSDGDPTDGKYIQKKNFVTEWQRYNKYKRVMMFTISVSNDKGKGFMADLAEGTNGFFLDVGGKKK